MEQHLLKSWEENAHEWIKVLEGQKIPSRKYTDRAIVALFSELPITKILDCGCGEGWLTRRMTGIGKEAVGVDATVQLIEHARTQGKENYYHLGYADIRAGTKVPESPFDAIVFNFCLYEDGGLVPLLKQIKKALKKKGYLVIQTLHPFYLIDRKLGYQSQWLPNSWEGLPGDFSNGHAWYARTLEDWISVFNGSGLRLVEIKEVTTNENEPISIIFLLQ